MLIIGELLNATRRTVKEAIIKKDSGFLQKKAVEQDKAGADYIDLNVSMSSSKLKDDVENMKWAVEVIKKVTSKPLCIDTTSLEVLQAGLENHGPGAMVNSISAEEGRLEPFLNLARKYKCIAIALPMDSTGIPQEISKCLEICKKIIIAAENENFPKDNIYFDPLAMPLGTDEKNALRALKTLNLLKNELEVKTTIGLSNVSYGLPLRTLLNRTFLTQAIYEGLDSVILDPLDKAVMSSLYASVLLTGEDQYCSKYLESYRSGILVM